MRVFISWSGRHSRAVAEALRDWLPLVINDVQPFMSAEDIDAGARWQMEIATQLEETHFGLICVTRANQTAPWLNFEAGALAKAVGGSRVVPLAIDCKPTDIPPPLGQFQAQSSTREGIGRVLTALNNTLDTPLPATRLARASEKWWQDLTSELDAIADRESAAARSHVPERPEREILEEILSTVRAISRTPTAVGNGDQDIAVVARSASQDISAAGRKASRAIRALARNLETSTEMKELLASANVSIQVGWSGGWCRVLDCGVTLV
jgi:hypothetical protein